MFSTLKYKIFARFMFFFYSMIHTLIDSFDGNMRFVGHGSQILPKIEFNGFGRNHTVDALFLSTFILTNPKCTRGI